MAFFALLSGVFYPLITENPAEQNLDNVIKGTAILFLGLVGAILVYKGTTSDKNRAAVVSFGLILIAVSLALIFTIAGPRWQTFVIRMSNCLDIKVQIKFMRMRSD